MIGFASGVSVCSAAELLRKKVSSETRRIDTEKRHRIVEVAIGSGFSEQSPEGVSRVFPGDFGDGDESGGF